MKQNVLKLSLAVALAAGGTMPAMALDPVSAARNLPDVKKQFSLEDLVGEALGANPKLKFYEAEITAAQAGRKTAGLLANPGLSADQAGRDLSPH